MPLSRVKLFSKIWMGVRRCQNILAVAVFSAAIAAVIIWTFEHNVNSEFDPMFVSGGGLLEGLYNLQLIYKTE